MDYLYGVLFFEVQIVRYVGFRIIFVTILSFMVLSIGVTPGPCPVWLLQPCITMSIVELLVYLLKENVVNFHLYLLISL